MPLLSQSLIHRGFRLFCRTFHIDNNNQTVSAKHNDSVPEYLSGADDNALQLIKEHFKVYENFVSETEETELMKEIDLIIKRRRYENDHWDGVSKG